MARQQIAEALYWDASAVLSALLRDVHSAEARREVNRRGAAHLISSLAAAEVHAVLSRLERERVVTMTQADEVRKRFAQGPWRRSLVQPDPESLPRLARCHPLRGADLWHLGAATALAAQLPGLRMLTFDDRLRAAARNEGL